MLGTIIGDIAGSRFEFRNHKGKDFEIFHEDCEFTDDSVMTLAIAKALIESKEDFEDLSEKTIFYMKEIGRPYRDCGYGGMFRRWIYSDATEPYGSYGNGVAMRVSACGFIGQTIEEVKMLARKVTEVRRTTIPKVLKELKQLQLRYSLRKQATRYPKSEHTSTKTIIR